MAAAVAIRNTISLLLQVTVLFVNKLPEFDYCFDLLVRL